MEGHVSQIYAFDDLPEEIVGIIWSYLCPSVKRRLSKTLYAEHHGYIVPVWKTHRYFSYVRFLIRNSCIFPLRTMIARDGALWTRAKRWQLHSVSPKIHYLHYLQSLCIEQNTTRCREALAPLLHALTEKRYRKVRGPHDKRWTS